MDSILVDSIALQAVQDTLAYVSQDSIVSLLHTLIENTAPDPTPRLGIQMYQWNFWIPIIALIAGLIGTYYGWKGYFFSKKTAENVARLSPDAQYALCRNFAVQLYKNLVRIMVLKYKVKHEKDITQDEIIALHLPKFEDVFFVDAYYKDADAFMVMQKMKVDFQAYDELITHLSKKGKQEEADMQKLLAFAGQLLAQTKDIALLIRKTSTSMKTNSWTIKEAIGNAMIESYDARNSLFQSRDWITRLIPKYLFALGIGLGFVYFIMSGSFIEASRIQLVVMFALLTIMLYIAIDEIFPPLLTYISFRKNPNKLYIFKFKHSIQYKWLRWALACIFFICFSVVVIALMDFIPAIIIAIENANTILLCVFSIVIYYIAMILFINFTNTAEKITKINKGNHLGQQLKRPANSVLDFFLMILVQHHSKHILDNKEQVSSIQSSINEEYLSYTKEIEITHVLSVLQSIQYAQNYPNPLYDKDMLQRYHLPTQDTQEFMHWAEDVRLPQEYRQLIKKRTWTLEEIETLFGYMLSVDAVIETSN